MMDISLSINIAPARPPRFCGFYPSESVLLDVHVVVLLLLLQKKNTQPGLSHGENTLDHWKEMQLPPPSRILITEP